MVLPAGNDGDHIHVIGHRGAAALSPENTLRGFALAMELGVDAVECDVQLTRDGHAVLMHDDRVDRTTDGSGRVADLDRQHLRALDAGQGEPVPTLGDLLDLLDGQCHLFCELKADGTEEPAAREGLRRELAERVTFISFRLERLARLRRIDDRLRVGALFAAAGAKDLDEAAALGACYVGIHERYVRPGVVERIRASGAAAGAWTPNRLDAMQRMIDAGATHITTDRPDLLLHWLRRPSGSPARSARRG